jgi:hypothetical protein
LTEGEAEWYRGVEVMFVSGVSPTLALFRDGVAEGEPMDLTHFSSESQLHELFQGLGFEKKTQEEIDEISEQKFLEGYEKRQRMWKQSEYFHERVIDIENFRTHVMQEKGVTPLKQSQRSYRNEDILLQNYQMIFGNNYLTMAEKLAKAEAYLAKYEKAEMA